MTKPTIHTRTRYLPYSYVETDGTVADLIQSLQKIVADSGRTADEISVDLDSSYDTSSVNWGFSYQSPETDEERNVRLAREARGNAYFEAAQRRQYEELKKKFGD